MIDRQMIKQRIVFAASYFKANWRKDKRLLVGLILTLVIVVGLSIHIGGVILRQRMLDFLKSHGVGEAYITNISRDRGDEFMFTDIKLGKDGFSTIGAIRARLRWPFILFTHSFSEIIIDHLALTGELSPDDKLTIDGLNLNTLWPLVETDSLILNGGQIDLSTGAGALRFQGKGRMTRQPDGGQKLEGALWGSQYQLLMDTRWTILVSPRREWDDSVSIHEARLNFQDFSVGRLTGWVKATGAPNKTPVISSQIDAGEIHIGNNTTLSDVDMTMNGPWDNCHITLHGMVNNHKDMILSTDMLRGPKDTTIHASVTANRIDDLLTLIQNLHGDATLAFPRSSLLTTLLITPGNLSRIRSESARASYKNAELIVDGVPDGLSGKILLHSDGKDIAINLNPAGSLH